MADNTTTSPAHHASNAAQSAAGNPRNPTPEKTPKKKRSLPVRMLRGLLWLLLALVLLLAALLGGAWWWSGQDDSLARVIAIVQRYLPAEQKLQATDVRGSLRHGGSVGNLQWSNPSLTVDMSGATIGWTLDNIWDKEVRLAPIHIQQLTITPSGLEKPKEPTQPLEQLPLPLRVLEVPFAVDEIVWAAEKPITIAGLQGHYLYQSDQHQLQISSVQAFNGSYQAKATLGALAPMALEAQLQAHVEQPATETLPAIVADAKAHVSGQLAGADATLRVQAQLQPQPQAAALPAANSKPGAPPLVRSAKPTASSTAAQRAQRQAAQVLAQAPPMQADVDATVYPWKSWPLGPLQAKLQSINLAAFLPQLPTTLLSGELTVSEALAERLASVQAQHAAPPLPVPAADTPGEEVATVPLPVPLDIMANLTNALPGPINEQRLPISQLQAQALFDGKRIDVLEGTALHVGNGSLQASGLYRLADQHAALSAVLQALNPALIDTRIDSAPLSGKLSAQSQQQAILFDADIRSQQAPAVRSNKPAATLPIERIIAKGQWKAPELRLASAQIDALGAHISANQLLANTEQLSGGGQLSAQVPGATLEAKAQAAPIKGQGDVALKLASAEQLLQWLRKLPGVAEAMPPALQAQGSLDAQLRFSGGYGDALRQLRQAGLLAQIPAGIATQGAQAFALDANISTPQLRVRSSEAAADWQLRNTKLLLSGNLAKVQADLQTEARQGDQQFAGQLQLAANSGANQQWSGSLSRLQASATLPPNKKPWQLLLQQPLDFKLQLPQGKQALQVSTGASQLQLSGPEPGTVTLQWNPLQFSQAADKSLQLQSTGTVQGLPLRWARAFQKPDANQNQGVNPLDSDLVVQGRWDINTSNGLNAKLLVERASGDLRLHSQSSAPKSVTFHSSGSEGSLTKAFAAQGQTITAGIRSAQVELNVQDRQVQAQVRWDSVNAGQLTANLQTALQYEGKDYLAASLAPDAPLSGTIKAQMPDLGIWANFAPPGWRVAGSLGADVQLSGNLRDPRWAGTVTADKMQVQSQLDGVDLRNGSLRARLNGNELQLQNLHFDGGEGSHARIIGFSGNLTPAPTAGGTLDASGTIRWSMPEGGGKPDIQMDIRAEAKALQVLVRADRQVSVSGEVRSQLQQGQMSITGKLKVDRASIMLANESAPTLGSDVVVHTKASRAAAAEKAKQAAAKAAAGKLEDTKGGITTAQPLRLAVSLDLGDDFALQGYGITTRLRGELNVQNAAGNTSGIGMPRITGEITTVEGRYRAWGQVLNVETGLIRFNGPYNNPSLDILALRPNIAVKAGVQVTGSAMAPRVNLYSDPVMPDAEKISWVVMGRDPAGGGANSAMMQQAALALLGGGSGESLTGNIAQSLGLDEIGFGGDDSNGGSLSLGKRLSKDLYVTYEAGLAGTLGALYIFYDFTRNLQLRGSAGTSSAVDLIYTLRYE